MKGNTVRNDLQDEKNMTHVEVYKAGGKSVFAAASGNSAVDADMAMQFAVDAAHKVATTSAFL